MMKVAQQREVISISSKKRRQPPQYNYPDPAGVRCFT